LSRGPQAVPTALFIALVCAAGIVAALAFRARTPDLALEVTRMPKLITPNGDGKHDVANITFFTRESDPRARVEIVGRNLKLARTLAADRALQEDQSVNYVWDGRTNAGKVAKPGNYRLRVILPQSDRDIVFTRQLALRR
jgi:hypothetical protein